MFVTEPRVYLLGKTKLYEEELEAFLGDEELLFKNWDYGQTDGEIITETAGRLCYMSFENPRPGGTKAYLDHIKKVGHGSVLEHVSYNFLITNVPVYFTHELVRHRAGTAFSQLSGRYVDMKKADIYIPYWVNKYDKTREQYTRAVSAATVGYSDLQQQLTVAMGYDADCELTKQERKKAINSECRAILPQGLCTKICFSANVRALRHCIEVRTDKAAERTIRQVFNDIYDILCEEDPIIFRDYKIEKLCDETGEIKTDNRKV